MGQGHECYHCKQWVEPGEAHDCWTTTEAALTADLAEDLRDAWERLRHTAAGFGEQRIYASHHCIMFSRTACYCFVRPKRSALEVVFFLGRTVAGAQIRRTERPSQKKVAHIVHVRHRDEVEPPLTEWIREAYDVSEDLSRGARASRSQVTTKRKANSRAKTKTAAANPQKRATKRGTTNTATRTAAKAEKKRA